MKSLLFALLMLLLAACSSFKAPLEPQAKLDADTYYNQGMKWEGLKEYENASTSYQKSLLAYRSIGEAKGVAASICAQARIALATGDSEGFTNFKSEATGYISEVEPALAYQILLLEVYQAQMDEDYSRVSELAEYDANYPLDVKLQLAAAKLQADTHLGIGTPSLASDLEKLASKYRKQLKKKASNAELYSLAIYSMAFYHYGQKNYDKTLDYLAISNKSDYIYGNLIALGHGLWLKGQAEVASGNTEAALSSLRKAEDIFESLGETEALTGVQNLFMKIKGKP